MRWQRSFGVVIGTFLSSALLTAQQVSPLPPLPRPLPRPLEASIGIVRADGVLLPFAALRDEVWRSLVTPNRTGGSQMTAEAKALPAEGWSLVPLQEGDTRPLVVKKPATTVQFECSTSEAFDTSFSAPQRLRGEETGRNQGLAIQGNGTIERAVDLIVTPDPASQRVRELIDRTVQALETERFEDPAVTTRYWPKLGRFTAALRAERPVHIRKLFRHSPGTVTWYYFEAAKDYSDAETEVFVSGWIGTFGADAYMTEVHAVLAGAGLGGGPVGSGTQVLGVVPTGRFYATSAAWVIAMYSNVDVIFRLVQVGDIGNERYSIKRVLEVSANHCVP